MPKTNDQLKPKKHTTDERLRATPFSNAEDLDKATKSIRQNVWERLTESKIINELLTKPEFKHILEEFKSGLICSQQDNPKEEIYKVFSEGKGLRLELNKNFTKAFGECEAKFIQGVVQSGVEGYGNLYFQVKGLFFKSALPEKDKKSSSSRSAKKKK